MKKLRAENIPHWMRLAASGTGMQCMMAFFTSSYDVFEAFLGSLTAGLQIVNSAVGLSFCERIGIRYLNAVLPRSGEQLDHYLIPQVLGLAVKLGGTIEHAYSETKCRLDNGGGVAARAIVRNARVGLPPELGHVGLTLSERFTAFEGMHGTLDTDAFLEKRVGFDIATIQAHVRRLDGDNEKVFRTIATPRALKVWE